MSSLGLRKIRVVEEEEMNVKISELVVVVVVAGGMTGKISVEVEGPIADHVVCIINFINFKFYKLDPMSGMLIFSFIVVFICFL